MLKEGLYVSENHENALEAYTIKMHVKETEKSYIFTLIDFESRYSGAHIEMLFKNSKRFVLRKNRGGHALQTWGDDDFTFYPYQAGIPYYFKMIEDPKENHEADKMRVVIYARNACLNQKAVDSQRRQLERYAEENNYEVAAVITLDGIPGNGNENMMEYLLNVAKRQNVDTILTCDKTCISRDVPELLKIVQKFRENGIRFEYLSQTDAESPVDSLLKLFDNVYKEYCSVPEQKSMN